MIVKRKERDKVKKGNLRVIEDKLFFLEKFNLRDAIIKINLELC